LERQHPFQCALETFVALLAVIGRNFPQSEQDHRGVVDVRIPLVFKFKHPPARFDFGGILVLPIAAKTDFFRHDPFGRPLQRGMIARETRFVEANVDDGGVPDGGETGFDPDAVFILVLEFFQLVFGAEDERMVFRITEGLESNQRIEHRRKDSAEAIRAFEAFNHPLFGFAQRALAERMNAVFREPFGKFMQTVESQEEVAPGQSLGIGRKSEIALVDAFGIQFI